MTGVVGPLGHDEHVGAEPGTALPAAATITVLVALGYLVLAYRARRDGRGWSRRRVVAFVTGCALLVVALTPVLSPYPAGDFRGHMLQHLLIGMLAPLALMLGRPVTLLLRTVPPRYGRRLGRVLRSRPAHLLVHPGTALLLTLGGLAALYGTPVYAATLRSPALHHVVHLHFLLAGYLFAWAVAGRDPGPRRPSVPVRLVLLGVAVAGHATLAQLMYAGLLGTLPVPADQLRGGAELMYYGGDIADLLLALALLTGWRPDRRPGPAGRPAPAPVTGIHETR